MFFADLFEIILKKEQLTDQLKQQLEKLIQHFQKEIKHAQESANAEEKSSAGDKYETSRAMSQINRDMFAKQLARVKVQYNALQQIPAQKKSLAEVGSLVVTNKNQYFLAIGFGKLEVNQEVWTVISPVSPIAQAMQGKKQGESFEFNGSTEQILSIQ